jgi:hypothetical protein
VQRGVISVGQKVDPKDVYHGGVVARSPLCVCKQATQNSSQTAATMSQGDYRVADISLADFGRREIELAEFEVSRSTHTWFQR